MMTRARLGVVALRSYRILDPSPASAGSRTQNVAHAALGPVSHPHASTDKEIREPTSHATKLLGRVKFQFQIEFICAHMYGIESLYRA